MLQLHQEKKKEQYKDDKFLSSPKRVKMFSISLLLSLLIDFRMLLLGYNQQR
jgi:hypothetical protein